MRVPQFRQYRRSRTGVGALVLLLLLWGGAGRASAETTLWEANGYATDFGVSIERAEEVLELQHHGAEVDIVGQLENRLGERYAGVWFDNRAGEFVVPLVAGTDSSSVEALFVELDLQDGFRSERARYDWSQLEADQERLDRKLTHLAGQGLVRTSLDPRGNAVRIERSEALTDVQEGKLSDWSADAATSVELRDAKVGSYEPVDAACGEVIWGACDAPMRGGVGIGPAGSSGENCTAGFKAIGKSNGNRYVLTAGHCTYETPYLKASSYDEGKLFERYLGYVEEQRLGDGWDVSKINATGTPYWDAASPWPTIVVDWGSKGWGFPVEAAHPITSEGGSFIGQYACHSGITTATHCSTVTKQDLTVAYYSSEYGKYVTYNHLTEIAPICVDGGDSGGPVYAGNTALGIVSKKDGELPQCGNYLLFQEITEATDLLNVTVAPRVSERSASVGDGDDNAPGPRAITHSNGTIDVFFRTSSGELGHRWFVPGGGGWSSETRSASIAASSTPRAVSHTGGEEEVTSANGKEIVHGTRKIDVFFRTTSGSLGHHWYVPGSGWSVETRSASMASDPVVTAGYDGVIDVFFRTTSGSLGHHWYVPGSGWSVETQSASMASDPHVIRQPNGVIDVFFRTTSGELGHHWYVPGGSWAQGNLPGSVASDPHPVVQGDGTIDVFYRTSSGTLGHNWKGAGGGSWAQANLTGSVAGDPHAVVQPNGTIDVFYRTQSGGLGHNWYSKGGSWAQGGLSGSVASDPTAVARTNGTIDVFYRTPSGNLGHNWYVSGGSWAQSDLSAAMASAPHAVGQSNGTIDVFYRTTGGDLGHHWYDTGGAGWLSGNLAGPIASRPPVLGSESASSIGETQATVNASINPEGSPVSYSVEYGTTTSYGSKKTASLETGTYPVSVSQPLTGLTANTTYHYRVVASGPEGTTTGSDKTFKTTTSTATQLSAMALSEPFDGSPTSLANFSANWAALGWAGGGTPKGEDTTAGWRPLSAHPTVNGAYYSPTVSDAGQGVATVATMATNPSSTERYFSLWLDMPSPSGTTRGGYELRFYDVASNTYNVTLFRWQSGSSTELASKASYSFLNGSSLALVDKGGTVSAWTNTGSGFTQLLSAADSTFSSGKTGLEGAGNITRLNNFKAGAL
jgi:hypothetical protein